MILKRSATMVLIQDKRHGKLLLRAAACAHTLEARHGTLADYDSPAAENLVERLPNQHFCTHRLGQPGPMRGLQEPKRDHDLLRRMRQITEMLVSDAASSETGGAAEMRTVAMRLSRRTSRLAAETLPTVHGQS